MVTTTICPCVPALKPALMEAGRTRFRPILMTSLAAILGLFPLALGIGPGAQMQQPLAIMVIGGLTANMLFTRAVIPAGYEVLEQLLEVAHAGSAVDDSEENDPEGRLHRRLRVELVQDDLRVFAAFQIHGAYGVSEEYPVGRYLRDAKVFQIVEGNNELHRSLIAESATGLR